MEEFINHAGIWPQNPSTWEIEQEVRDLQNVVSSTRADLKDVIEIKKLMLKIREQGIMAELINRLDDYVFWFGRIFEKQKESSNSILGYSGGVSLNTETQEYSSQ
jgi:hypothetical protein